jgi:hypothetical protein
MDQQHYVGLDVSLETISICVVDQTDANIWRGNAAPSQIPSARLCVHTPARLPRVGLETVQMSNWLTL